MCNATLRRPAFVELLCRRKTVKACLEQGDEQRNGETHRPGRTDQDGAKKANPLTVFGQKPGDERTQCRHDCVKDQHFLIQRHFVHLI